MCHLTDHAVQRTKERVGLPKRSAEKNAQKALENGIRHCETKGSLNRYITALYWKHKTANNIRVYCNNVYIFNIFPLFFNKNELSEGLASVCARRRKIKF